jgi:hypothetical protein
MAAMNTPSLRLLLACIFSLYRSVSSNDTCGVWLAPSTLPGGGLGMFAGQSFSKNAVIDLGEGDVVVPMTDVTLQNSFRSYYANPRAFEEVGSRYSGA